MKRAFWILLVSLAVAGPGAVAADETDTDYERDTDTWEAAVDEFWGDAPDVETRLAIFDDIWETLADDFAAFGTTDIDWDQVYDEYRPEVEQAQSYGRFYQLLSEIYARLNDCHNYLNSDVVCGTPNTERPPYFNHRDWNVGELGVCVTLLPDDTLLVYRTETENPIGLEPGDLVLGFDGVPWRELLEQIEDWQLPLCGHTAAAESANDYYAMVVVLSNAHLFEQLDIRRHESDTVESIPTDDLMDYLASDEAPSLLCTDQLPVEGAEFPWTDWDDFDPELSGDGDLTWGVLTDVNVGYVYSYSWYESVSGQFEAAVEALMETDGLIIDSRWNLGGYPQGVAAGARWLFDTNFVYTKKARRDHDAEDYYTLEVFETFALVADPQTFYDNPIAVLTGPKSGSAGDVIPLMLSQHPRARRFGRATNGSFSGAASVWGVDTEVDPYLSDITASYAELVNLDNEDQLLHGSEQTPDVEVWLTQEDVANGVDTVVEAALDWIAEENGWVDTDADGGIGDDSGPQGDTADFSAHGGGCVCSAAASSARPSLGQVLVYLLP